jgi:glutathione S-transferase
MTNRFGESTLGPEAELVEWYQVHNGLTPGTDGVSLGDMNSGREIIKMLMTPDTPYVAPETIQEWMPCGAAIMAKFKEMPEEAQGKQMAAYATMQDPKSAQYKAFMAKADEMFAAANTKGDGRLNEAEFLAYKAAEHQENIKRFGDDPKSQDHWKTEYGLYNKITPEKDGLSMDDMMATIPIWGAVMEAMASGEAGASDIPKLISFPVHGKALMIRLALTYANCKFEDCHISPAELQEMSSKGTIGENTELPCLMHPDGTEMTKAYSILRFVCLSNKGRKGECLYPGHADADLTFKIESVVELLGDGLNNKIAGFTEPSAPTYKDKDQNFINFIAKDLPDVMAALEAMLVANGTKYLAANHVTLADFVFGGLLLKLPYNDKYAN